MTRQSNAEVERGMTTYRYIQAEILRIGPDENTEEFLNDMDSFLDGSSENIRLQCLNKAFIVSGLQSSAELTPESAKYWRALYRCKESRNKYIADYLDGLLERLKKIE